MKSQQIERLLPRIYQETLTPESPLAALLNLMEELHAPTETVLKQIETYFNPYRTPENFVPYLASWLDLDRFFPSYCEQPAAIQRTTDAISPGNGRLREMIAAAVQFSHWRGTARGMKLFLEVATGTVGFELNDNTSDEHGRPRPFHIQILAPPEAARHRVLIERIIKQEKPAYITYELEFKAAAEEELSDE